MIDAHYMGKDWFSFRPSHTAILCTNHAPESRGTDDGIWRRVFKVPFDQTIPPERQDKRLAEKLELERAGILRWLVAGLEAYHAEGLNLPPEVQARTQEYRQGQDVVRRFLEERCTLKPEARAKFSEVAAAFEAYCGEEGERPIAKRTLRQRLNEACAAMGHALGDCKLGGQRAMSGLELTSERTEGQKDSSGQKFQVAYGEKRTLGYDREKLSPSVLLSHEHPPEFEGAL
jgi:phage/plasmid-associated DNA primase